MSELSLILGNQLFDLSYYKSFPKKVFMAETKELCTHFKYHKHKLIHFLSSMRIFAQDLKKSNFTIHYIKIEEEKDYIHELENFIKKNDVKTIHLYEIEDHFFEKKLFKLFKKHSLNVKVKSSPMFMCSRKEFKNYLESTKKPFLNNFYIEQRKNHHILLENGSPKGGQWNFDQENRKKIPKKFNVTDFFPTLVENETVKEVKRQIDVLFPDHPGSSSNFWIPVDAKEAKKLFHSFLKSRFENFGRFQDAIDQRNPFLYHSLISPLMNIGFLTPEFVIKEVEKSTTKENLNSGEGFIRQVLGWREFMRGIYQNYDDQMQQENFFNHKKKLRPCWYEATTDIAPLDDAISKALNWGYCHHIERLMIIGNLMLLLEVDPKEVYQWFMEMFVDSSDWVMAPNVFGMSQFSDGGIFATKPYVSGSNYILKMSHYSKKEEWSAAWDGLFWRFIERKKDILKNNHRMSMMVNMLEKMDKKKKKNLFKLAEKYQERLTC